MDENVSSLLLQQVQTLASSPALWTVRLVEIALSVLGLALCSFVAVNTIARRKFHPNARLLVVNVVVPHLVMCGGALADSVYQLAEYAVFS